MTDIFCFFFFPKCFVYSSSYSFHFIQININSNKYIINILFRMNDFFLKRRKLQKRNLKIENFKSLLKIESSSLLEK